MNAETPRRRGRTGGGILTTRPSSLFFSPRLGVSAFILLFLVPAARAAQEPKDADYLLHLPGIAGYHWVDKQMIAGLREGGYAGRIAVHDWTGDNAGLGALINREQHDREATRVATALEKRFRENPGRRIILTAHSGGTGIAVWALEKLPDDVQVDTVILLASALSPDYDLTAALKHVRGTMYALTSATDSIVLGVGTKTFGTIDGVKCEAAGKVGFTTPDGADEQEYAKLHQMPYQAEWLQLGNLGDHIGPLGRLFTRTVLTPIVLGRAPTRSQISNLKSRLSNLRSNLPLPRKQPPVGEQSHDPDPGVQQRRAPDPARQ
jgi:pimeloyl-ACP methyl ester carboxylesterase